MAWFNQIEVLQQAERAGRAAFRRGAPYSDNPFTDLRAAQRLAWSNGHNWERVAAILSAERREMDERS